MGSTKKSKTALLAEIKALKAQLKESTSAPLTAAELAERVESANDAALSEWEKQRAEPHYWVTFFQGEDDPIDEVHIGAAGVSYNIRKGERVPLPVSAIEALKLAVVRTVEPVVLNGKRYRRTINRHRFPYQMDGEVTAQELAEFRRAMAAAQRQPDLERIENNHLADGSLQELQEATL